MTLIAKLKNKASTDLKRNFGLTESEFDLMIEQMRNGNEIIFEKIFLSHFSDCMMYLKVNYNIQHSHAYDLSMDTLLDFRKGLHLGKYKYGNLRFLFTKMATQRFIKQKKKSLKVDLLDEFFDIELETDIDNQDEIKTLQRAWARLDNKSQSLLKQFYVEKMKLSEIAILENKSHTAIRKQKERALTTLRKNYNRFSTPSLNNL